jgi:hypothetical protein
VLAVLAFVAIFALKVPFKSCFAHCFIVMFYLKLFIFTR